MSTSIESRFDWDASTVVMDPEEFSEPFQFGGKGSGGNHNPTGINQWGKLGTKYKTPEDFIKGATAADIEKLYSLPGLKAQVDYLKVVPGNYPILRTAVRLVDKDGNRVATLQREFIPKSPDGPPHVYHDLFSVRDEHQGEGLAARINKQAEEHYRSMGFEEVHLSADIDVGKYAWARQGYDFLDNSAASVRSTYISRLKDHIAGKEYNSGKLLDGPARTKIENDAKAKASKLMDELAAKGNGNIHAWDLAALDDGSKYPWKSTTKKGDGHVGKALLLGAESWYGVKSLSPNSPSKKISDAYFKSKIGGK